MADKTGKRRFDRRWLGLFRYLTTIRGMSQSEACDHIVQIALAPTDDPTESELRWIRAVATRVKAEAGDDEPAEITEADAQPLLDHLDRLGAEANSPGPDPMAPPPRRRSRQEV